jgi:hypothetical protein
MRFRRVLPTGPGVRGRVGRAGSPPSTSGVVDGMGGPPSTSDHASTSGPTKCPTGSTLQITRRDCPPRWTISPLPLNAERRLPRSHGARRYGDPPCRSDAEGQIYGRQLQQAGDYTGPHRDRSGFAKSHKRVLGRAASCGALFSRVVGRECWRPGRDLASGYLGCDGSVAVRNNGSMSRRPAALAVAEPSTSRLVTPQRWILWFSVALSRLAGL